jgi:hypothetical protein
VTPQHLVEEAATFDNDAHVVLCNHISVAGLGALAEHATVVDSRQMKRPTNLGRVMQLRNFRDYIHSRLNLRANDWMLHNRRTHFFCESWFPIRLRLTCGKLLLYKNDNSIEVQVMSSILDMSEQIFVMRHAHVLVLNHSKDKTTMQPSLLSTHRELAKQHPWTGSFGTTIHC